jgi:hypothetical protein
VAWLLLLFFGKIISHRSLLHPRKRWSSGNLTSEKQRNGWLFFAVPQLRISQKSTRGSAESGLEDGLHSSASIAKTQVNTEIGNANFGLPVCSRSGLLHRQSGAELARSRGRRLHRRRVCQHAVAELDGEVADL